MTTPIKTGRPTVLPDRQTIGVPVAASMLAEVDRLRGSVPRATWVRHAIQRALRNADTRAAKGESE